MTDNLGKWLHANRTIKVVPMPMITKAQHYKSVAVTFFAGLWVGIAVVMLLTALTNCAHFGPQENEQRTKWRFWCDDSTAVVLMLSKNDVMYNTKRVQQRVHELRAQKGARDG